MTIIKQVTVKDGSSHQKNLRKYINNDEKVLLRDSQNMEMCPDIKQWASFMKNTREMFGHNKSVRKGKNGEKAKNAILLHQILGFNPDECDVNGGMLSPQDCMKYAKEYAASYYPNHEIVFALHNEFCKEDKTHRYAVHMVINRSDLATGKRLDEGKESIAKKKRVSRVRSMDETWGLKQVEEGKINSTTHSKQPSRVEKEIEKRGILPYKTNLRELLRIAARKTDNLVEFREQLDQWGVDTEFRNGRMYATDRDNAKYSFSVLKLDAHLESFARDTDKIHEHADHTAQLKTDYLAKIKTAYLKYRKELKALPKDKVDTFPKLTLPKPHTDIANDSDVKREILAYWRGADELKKELSPTTKHRPRRTSDTQSEYAQQQQTYTQQIKEKNRNQER
ncbi:Relaxase/mobilization nuclease domain protein [Streptococcus equi subsp. zooepidemicus Sz12is]|uniref:relaxase/mobilization nuclease domain-containing protein n=1 Tax=Streptococcus equi TaxID=1336 RepID=UPI0005BB729C|nr:relaxase/mobilization nuclease domain-containing protein [Streptococcus equi]KIS05192.1 Relaxase/mobilization nuclease domain protein [Streptococcus equi subsp. zooepidemicus Sz12is]